MDKYLTLVNQLPQGFCLLEGLVDSTGLPVNYRVLEVNPKFEQLTGLVNAVGKTVYELQAAYQQPWFALSGQVLQSGQAVHVELPAAQVTGKVWYDIVAFPFGPAPNNQVAILLDDITPRKRTEETLRQSEEKYRNLFNSMDEGMAMIEVFFDEQDNPIDFRIREINPAYEAISGVSRAIVDQSIRDYMPTIEDNLIELYGGVARTGESVRFEVYVSALDRWFDAYASRVGQAGSPYVAIVFNNITQRKRYEQQQAYLLTLTDSLRHIADPVAIEQTVTRLAMQQFAADRCYYCRVEDGQAIISRDAMREGLPSVAGTYPLSSFALLKKVIDVGQPFVVEDAATTPILDEPLRDLCLQLQVISFIDVPIIKNGQAVGVLCTVQSIPRSWTEMEIQLAVETAERTWAAVERARSEEAFRESERRLRLAIEATELAIWEWNLTTNEVYWNEQHFRLFGMQPLPMPLTPDTFMNQVHPVDRERISDLLQKAIAERSVYEAEFGTVLENGSQRWISVYGRITEERDGQPLRMSSVMFDISERRRAEDALRLADQRKDEFLAMLAHELRNPLSTIRSGLNILSLTADQDQTAVRADNNATLAMMNRQMTHLVRLVDDLLDVSRISRGRIELQKERVNLVALVSQAQQSMQSQFAQQGKTLRVSLPPADIELEGDSTRLTQLLTNLLTNGLRYTGEHGQVWLSLTHRNAPTGGTEAIIEVKDNGIGLAAHQLSAIFELFVQVDNSPARSQGGLGLGLTLVRRIAELHGGRVEAQSDGVGQGSTFTVHLPTLTVVAEEAQEPARQATDSPAARRILVVDDNLDAAFALTMLLKMKGYEAHTRTSGRAGIEAAQQLQPAAILLDIGMPELDGYETCRLIRQQPWGQTIVVIALTGYGQAEDRQRTKEAGFDEHLVKPVDLAALLSLLPKLPHQNNPPSE